MTRILNFAKRIGSMGQDSVTRYPIVGAPSDAP
jgi:hypothetical protein